MGRRTEDEQVARLPDEYARFHGKPAEIGKRAMRNSARAEMARSYGKAALAGKDVHHKKALRHGGGNGKGNLAVSRCIGTGGLGEEALGSGVKS